MIEQAFYLATSQKSGELITRDQRPLYATREQWDEVARILPQNMLIPVATFGLPFGALPLRADGDQLDVVGFIAEAMRRAANSTARQVAEWDAPC